MLPLNITELYTIYNLINIDIWITLSASTTIVGALANTYTVCVLVLYKEFQKPNYQLILCVSITDAVCDAIFIPIESFQSYILIKHKRLLGGSRFCIWEGGFYAICFSASILGQFLIALNRFIAVFLPNFYRTRMTTKLVLLVWAGLALLCPVLYYYAGLNTWVVLEIDPILGDCKETDVKEAKLVRTSLTIYIPLAGSLFLYALIILRILITTPAERMDVLKRAKGSAAMLASMLFYGMCVLPLWITLNSDDYEEVLEKTLWIKFIFRLSYTINPLFYATLDRQIRRGYVKLFRRITSFNKVSNTDQNQRSNHSS